MANATLRIWWFTNGCGFTALEATLGVFTLPALPLWAVQPRRPAKLYGLGHASLELPQGQRYISYISWGGTSKVADDTTRYGIEPEEVQIPLEGGGTKFGLNGQAISDWYYEWSRNRSYHPVTRNCCDCVVGALTAGGGLCYSPIGTRWLGYSGARTVLSWGKRIRDKVNEMNASWQRHWGPAKEMIKVARRAADILKTSDQMWLKVPTLAAWKKRSAVLIGARKEQILKMDQLVEEYDQMRNPDPVLSARQVLAKKLHILRNLLLWAADHLCTKRGSDRREAVLRLASGAWFEHDELVSSNRTGLRCARLEDGLPSVATRPPSLIL
jgi:hypothetical protein